MLKNFFFLIGMNHFKNLRAYGLVVLPQTRPSSFHDVEKPFRLDVLQPCKNIQVYGWAALPNFFCHGPAHFAALKNHFVLILCSLSTKVQMNGWSCSPKHGPAHFTVLKNLFIWIAWNVSTKFELMAGPCYPKQSPVFFTGLKNLFVWMLCSRLKTFKFMAGPRSPTSPVTAKLVLRRWRIISFCCYVDIQQPSNERLVVLPQTRSSSIHGVEEPFRVDGMKFFKNLRTHGWVVLPQTRPSSIHGVEEPFRLNVLQSCKNI